MAINKISEFPKVTPSADDKILIEKNGEGGHINLSEMPVSTPVNTKITSEVDSLKSRIDNLVLNGGNSPDECVDARRNDNTSITYPSLKARLDAENSELKGDLAQLQDAEMSADRYDRSFSWEKGTMTQPAFTPDNNRDDRCRTPNLIRLLGDKKITISTPNGIYVQLYLYGADGVTPVRAIATWRTGIIEENLSDATFIRIGAKNTAGDFNIKPSDCAGLVLTQLKPSPAVSRDTIYDHDGRNTIDIIDAEILNNRNRTIRYDLGTLRDGFITGNTGVESGIGLNSYRMTDYIPTNSARIRFNVEFSDAAGLAFYNCDKKYISGVVGTGHTIGEIIEIDVPQNARYFRTCAIAQYANLMYCETVNILTDVSNLLGNSNSLDPCDYSGSDAMVFRRVLCIGDSLTAGTFDYHDNNQLKYFSNSDYSYPDFFRRISGCLLTNKGSGGQSTKTWWDMHSGDDFSGHDCCIIELGLNDVSGGESVRTTSEERATAMTNIVTAVKSQNPGIKIFISSIFGCFTGAEKRLVNAELEAFASANDDVYYMDVYNNGRLKPNTPYVAGHLTAIGYQVIAQQYYNYIGHIIHNNLDSFKFVQYIGTDYQY